MMLVKDRSIAGDSIKLTETRAIVYRISRR